MFTRAKMWDVIITLSAISLLFLELCYGENELVLGVSVIAIFSVGNLLLSIYNKTALSWAFTTCLGAVLLGGSFYLGGIYVLSLYVGCVLFEISIYLAMIRPSITASSDCELLFAKAAAVFSFAMGVCCTQYALPNSDDKTEFILFILFLTVVIMSLANIVSRHVNGPEGYF